jgi:hypothetical protein
MSYTTCVSKDIRDLDECGQDYPMVSIIEQKDYKRVAAK